MRHLLDRDKFNFKFSKDIYPVARINSRDTVVFKTRDAHNQTVPKGKDVVFPDMDLKDTNPVNGPVYVNDSVFGDILALKIKKIKLGEEGFVPARKNMGSLKNIASKNLARNMQITDNLIIFSDEIKIPVRPMLGTIGVAPNGEEVYSVFVGNHGGNMDNNDIKEGSIIYLPVFVPGALLSAGDVHASMGDGELTSGGVDIPAEVHIEVELIKDRKLASPLIETKDSFIVTSFDSDFYNANRSATSEMIMLLKKSLRISDVEAYWLISICGDLKISQACDFPSGLTLRLSFPKINNRISRENIFR
ncbi:MAG: acetamidase/formamidase family protein [Candidatus Humimicrobiaceae bacterium]